jgi:hypothetical protein
VVARTLGRTCSLDISVFIYFEDDDRNRWYHCIDENNFVASLNFRSVYVRYVAEMPAKDQPNHSSA